jgi:two-component system, NtrC family, sensor histidine kinase HydH
MTSKLTLRMAAPAVALGLVLMIACLAGVRYINRIQRNLANILSDNVTSLRAAQELEISVRQLRFRSLLFLSDPSPERNVPIVDAQRRFENALADAMEAARKEPEEKELVGTIAVAYKQYQTELVSLRATAGLGQPVGKFHQIADSHPIQHVVEPCLELLWINKDKMNQTAEDSQRLAEQGYLAMILLGVVGPVGGLVMGYGVTRAVRQSIYRLSVRVQDMAQHLDRDVATVSVVADGDFASLDRQMQHIVGQVEAVTERLQRQQRELLRAEQLAAVGQLAAGVAHEVRNPLTGIKMLVEAAQRPHNPRPLIAEDLRVIHREVERLEQTVQGLLDFARLPAPRRLPCDLRDAALPARDLVRARAEQQGVAVTVHDPGRPAVTLVDRGQLQTVLVNLLLNALDALPTGGRVDMAWWPPEDGRLRITVTDNGPGIPATLADKLFTPFVSTKPSGTGLGLSLSARIIEEHGGTITASNRPEGGACFTITLPELASEDGRAKAVGH